jgi:ubiquinone/menaquinone biosynthesis C-methylase UbiE
MAAAKPMTARAKSRGTEGSPIARKYGDAAGYYSYMGHWSRALAPLFLDFVAVRQPTSLLDIGCGTGNLLVAAAAVFPEARLVGVDPSAALLRKAGEHVELAGAELLEGVAERLPFADETFDACLSLLVLQEFADRFAALREMRRVTRRGGVVAACQWDFARMPVIAALVDAIATIDPGEGKRLATRSPDLVRDEAELAAAWTGAGFEEVSAARIKVVRGYGDFDELWTSLLGGSTPSTLMLAALPTDRREAVRQRMRSRFHVASPTCVLELAAEALVVRGRA